MLSFFTKTFNWFEFGFFLLDIDSWIFAFLCCAVILLTYAALEDLWMSRLLLSEAPSAGFIRSV